MTTLVRKAIAAIAALELVVVPFLSVAKAMGETSLCCPADLNGDQVVDADDLSAVVEGWGAAGSADLDDSGVVDATDLGLLLGSWGACPTPCLKTLVVGNVEFADGTPVPQAVIVTDLGGKGVSGVDGAFSFAVDVGEETTSLRVTAVVSIRGLTYSGTKLVRPVVLDGGTDAGAIAVTANAPCDPTWLPTFGGAPGVDNTVFAVAVFDDGSGGGPALYAAGAFTAAGGVAGNRIAKWDGSTWSALGSGMNDTVYALTTFDDGSGGGPALYAGGKFTTAGGVSANRIAKWNGSSWSALGSGMNYWVFALTTFDDGTGDGTALYAAGWFETAGGVAAKRIARWNGSSWSPLGGGLNSPVYALTVFDDGSGGGPGLVAGGTFTEAGGVTANRIATWNGSSWSPLGSGMNGPVLALTVFDDGSGAAPGLYAGGDFTTAGGVAASFIARWDGALWSPLGKGVDDVVYALTSFDDGTGGGPALFAGGAFEAAGGASANFIAKWDGSIWSALGTGVSGSVRAFAVLSDPSGSDPTLYVGGTFDTAGGAWAFRIATWINSTWSLIGSGVNSTVWTLTVFDDGSEGGPALYAGGWFNATGGTAAHRIAKWNGTTWSPLAGGMDAQVDTLAVFDDGSGGGPALYAGGWFTTAGGVPANRVAKWDGTSWSALGTGLNKPVFALTVFDDGAGGGPALYAGGLFTSAGGVSADRIAKWDGSTWSALGSGMNDSVDDLTVFDDGSGAGPALYAAGTFTTADGVSANRIAKWDGSSWSALGIGMNQGIYALTPFDDRSGGGPALYAAGGFTTAGGVAASRVAKWDGSSWSALGSGMNTTVAALAVFDDGSGSGPALYAGGNFTMAGGVAASRIAKWNGSTWSPLGSGMTSWVIALAAFDDGSSGGPSLYAGGEFRVSPAGDSYLAKWGCGASGSGN